MSSPSMDLLAVAQLVADLDEQDFIDKYPHTVLIDLDSIAVTRQGALDETSEDLMPFRSGLLELKAAPGEALELGRSIHADLPVDDPNISSKHATLERKAGGIWIVKDHRSTNGTTINGHKLPANFPMPLRPGGVLGLGGSVRFTLLESDRLFQVLKPIAADYLSLIRGVESQKAAPPLDPSEVQLVARCDPFPALPLIPNLKITVGRAPDNEIVLPHPNVSRRHLTLERIENKVELHDLGSANGTYIGPERIQGQVEVKIGGLPIIVGPFEIRIETFDRSAVADPPGAEDTRRLTQVELRGNLETMPLRELLQSVELNRRTGTIRVEPAEGEDQGQVEFHQGAPYWATIGPYRGVSAVLQLIEVERGTFWFDPRDPVEPPQLRDGPRIRSSFTRIILEATRRTGETRKFRPFT